MDTRQRRTRVAAALVALAAAVTLSACAESGGADHGKDKRHPGAGRPADRDGAATASPASAAKKDRHGLTSYLPGAPQHLPLPPWHR
ncbi:hypothetical protein [Yinghuangia seranimata]|uniref:hypothetical protein n=1 Tax=Yinghuangia seranimata TaxID=408067 RepID=UPI00248C5D1F|nr:hypothetical protein [Yinghuangia seranimata]MDI2130794.1 hypothetical protein [Yinghuangia seranimata]